jgi:hypothetical protein
VRVRFPPPALTTIKGGHAVDIPFQFERKSQRMDRSVVASFASHAALFVLAVFLIRYSARSVAASAALPFETNSNIIWLREPGPGGGAK